MRALRYDVDMAIQQNGLIQVRETQELAFSGGPFTKGTRRIAMRRLTGVSDVRVEVDGQPSRQGSGSPGTYQVIPPSQGSAAGETRIEYWFPSTFNARRTVTISYVASGAVRYYPDGDQLRWNAVPSDRAYPVDRSTITLRLPASVGAQDWKIDAQPRSLLDDSRPPTASGTTATWNAADLAANQPLEIRAQWPHGLVAGSPPPWQEQANAIDFRRENLRPVLDLVFGAAALLVPIGGFLLVALIWYTRGKDPAIGAVPRELEEPPSELAPALVGVVVDERADVHDVVATMLDLASRGAISIREVAVETMFGNRRDFEIELVNRDLASAGFEQRVLDSLFLNGSPARLSEMGNWFGRTVPELQTALYESALQEGLFAANPETTRRRFRRLGTVLMLVSVVGGFVACSALGDASGVVGWPFIALLVVGAAVRFTAGTMPRRTAAGALEAARWQAYARYLRRAGPTAWLSPGGEGPPPKATLGKDLELDRVLPYAVALNLDRTWVLKLAAAGAPTPQWMSGPPVVVVGGPMMGGPMWGGPVGPMGPFGPVGGGWGPSVGSGGGHAAPGGGGGGNTGTDGDGGLQGASDGMAGGLERGSGSLIDLLNSASDVLSRGGGSDWSGGGGGGGSWGGGGSDFGGSDSGSGGGGSSFE